MPLLRRFFSTDPWAIPKLRNLPYRLRRAAVPAARGAVSEYLHSTRSLPSSHADSIAALSPRSLHAFLAALPAVPDSLPTFSLPSLLRRHLSFHPLNEPPFFLESIGLPPLPPPWPPRTPRPLHFAASCSSSPPDLLPPTHHHLTLRKRPGRLSYTAPHAAVSSSVEATSSDPSAVLRSLCSHGQLAQAIWFLESSLEPPDEDVYVALFHLCEWRRVVEAGLRACEHAYAEHARFGLRLGNAMLIMLVRFGESSHAWRVFAKMPEPPPWFP